MKEKCLADTTLLPVPNPIKENLPTNIIKQGWFIVGFVVIKQSLSYFHGQ